MTKPELLAPAGSWTAFLAGLEAGADAFYLGLKEWSARGRAENFELAELERLVPLAHGRGRKVYVAMNTLLKEGEMARAVETLWHLSCVGIDGLILQDLGLWKVCREVFPELTLHASTQMSVHNSAGVRQLEAMGFGRAVLARECTIPEIRAIRGAVDIPLEVFVHGALCFSVSGMCLASSILTGRSANRGWCAQPCRWGLRTEGRTADFHPFSASDLCLVEHLPALREAGVASLKIEGRLKGADYVHAVVSAYRKVLDAAPKDLGGAVGAARELLKSAASRPVTEGYAFHPKPREVLRRGEVPALGTRVGRVHRWRDGVAVIAVREALRRGDRIRVQTGVREEGVALVLREFRRETVPGGSRITFDCPERLDRGDPVYKVKDARGEELEQRLQQELRRLPKGGGLPLGLTVSFPAGIFTLRATCGPVEVTRSFPVPTHLAERHPLDFHTLEKHLGRLGGTGYFLAKLKVQGTVPPVVIPPSAFKEVRREVVRLMDEARELEGARRREASQTVRSAPPPRPTAEKRLWVRVESPRVLWAVADLGWDRIIVAIDKECLRARDRLVQRLKGRGRVVWELPPWIPEGDLPVYRKTLLTLAREGYREVMATNLAHRSLAEGLDLELRAGREVHVLNGWAAAALRDLGYASCTVSPEADREVIAAMAEGGWPIPALAYTYGNLSLFTTRLDPGINLPEGLEAEGTDGNALHWVSAPKPLGQDWARVYGREPLCWSQHMAELRSWGVGDYLFDFEGRPYGQKELKIVLKKFRTERSLADTTDANYGTGLK